MPRVFLEVTLVYRNSHHIINLPSPHKFSFTFLCEECLTRFWLETRCPVLSLDFSFFFFFIWLISNKSKQTYTYSFNNVTEKLLLFIFSDKSYIFLFLYLVSMFLYLGTMVRKHHVKHISQNRTQHVKIGPEIFS